MSNWIKLTDRLPEPGKQVWVLRQWVPMNPEFGTEPRTDIRVGIRVDSPLVTEGELWENCHFYSDGSNYSDLTVAGWQEIPPLVDVVRACNSHDQLLTALRDLQSQAEASLDFRPEFRRAISAAHAAIAEAEA